MAVATVVSFLLAVTGVTVPTWLEASVPVVELKAQAGLATPGAGRRAEPGCGSVAEHPDVGGLGFNP